MRQVPCRNTRAGCTAHPVALRSMGPSSEVVNAFATMMLKASGGTGLVNLQFPGSGLNRGDSFEQGWRPQLALQPPHANLQFPGSGLNRCDSFEQGWRPHLALEPPPLESVPRQADPQRQPLLALPAPPVSADTAAPLQGAQPLEGGLAVAVVAAVAPPKNMEDFVRGMHDHLRNTNNEKQNIICKRAKSSKKSKKKIVCKRPASSAEKPPSKTATSTFGCSKCRYNRRGCGKCLNRDPHVQV